MRLLWQSNAPWAGTGYGSQTRLLLPALKALGHDPHCFAFYGLSGGTVEYDGYTVWPNSDYDAFGNDVVKLHIQRSKADVLISLIDLFVLDEKVYSNLGVPWLAWTPIDSVGIGNVTKERLKICDPVAMSLFGEQQMLEADIKPIGTIYHAVNTDVFKPLDKSECRAVLGLPDDAWVIGMVMANKGDRKQYPVQLRAIKQFMDENKDVKVRVYIHAEPTNKMGGWDMKELVARSGLKNLVWSTNQYDAAVVPKDAEFMAIIYNSFDVLMNCSAGEGFGIPIVEAQACGVPVVTHGVTAMPELTINGYTVESGSEVLSGHFGWQYTPSVEDMVYRLNCVYRMDSGVKRLAGRAWVMENCSLPKIASQWDYLMQQLQLNYDERRSVARVRIV